MVSCLLSIMNSCWPDQEIPRDCRFWKLVITFTGNPTLYPAPTHSACPSRSSQTCLLWCNAGISRHHRFWRICELQFHAKNSSHHFTYSKPVFVNKFLILSFHPFGAWKYFPRKVFKQFHTKVFFLMRATYVINPVSSNYSQIGIV
jgi:hypothetical protein